MKTTIYKFASLAVIIPLALTFLNTSVFADQKTGTLFKGEKITIRIDGLSCPFCAYGLEKKLETLEGVEKLEIKVNDGIVFLYLKKGTEIAESVLREKVKEAGFTPREINSNQSEVTLDSNAQKVTMKIKGMTCQRCVEQVEKALSKIGCTNDVEVSLDKKEAILYCTGDETHQNQLVEAVEKLGFSAKIVEVE